MRRGLMIPLLVVLFAASASAQPPPGHTNAKQQLPAQASDRAQPPSKTLEVAPPPPPPVLPPVITQFIGGQTTSVSTVRAEDAIETATEMIKTKLASATVISVITMTGTRISRLITRFPPEGRAGDLEIVKFRFTDRYGRKIGVGTMLCRWANIVRRLCWGEAILPRGKLVAFGSSQTRVEGEFAVIGGTGVYLFKQGMMTFRAFGVGKYAIRVLLA